jgi:uncharacterized protein (TIGR03067 family)
MHRVLPLLAVALSSLAFAPAPFPKPNAPRDDLKKLQGRWVLIYWVEDGRRQREKEKLIWLIEGNHVSTLTDGPLPRPFFISLDPHSTPPAIDVRSSQKKPSYLFGRYSVDGDTLRVCFGKGKRPAGLSGGEEATFGVWVFQRPKR